MPVALLPLLLDAVDQKNVFLVEQAECVSQVLVHNLVGSQFPRFRCVNHGPRPADAVHGVPHANVAGQGRIEVLGVKK